MTPATGDITRLNALARQIRDGHEAAEQFVRLAKENAQRAIVEGILVGQALAQARQELREEQFEKWINAAAKTVSPRARDHYLKLQKCPDMSLRRAYELLGIIGETPAKVSTDGGLDG